MLLLYCSFINSFYRNEEIFMEGRSVEGRSVERCSMEDVLWRDVLWRKIPGLYHFYTIFLPLLRLPW